MEERHSVAWPIAARDFSGEALQLSLEREVQMSILLSVGAISLWAGVIYHK
jgi:hypothetical protein